MNCASVDGTEAGYCIPETINSGIKKRTKKPAEFSKSFLVRTIVIAANWLMITSSHRNFAFQCDFILSNYRLSTYKLGYKGK